MKKIWFLALFVMGMFMFAACDDSSEEVTGYEEDVAAMLAQSYNTNGSDEMYSVERAILVSGSSNGTDGEFELEVDIPYGFGSGLTRFDYAYAFTGCGEEGCDAMDWQGSHSGEWTWNRFSYSFERSYEFHLTGCLTDEITVNGQGSASVQMDFAAAFYNYQRHYDVSYAHEYRNVVLSRTADYPLSGTVVFDVDGERTRTTKKNQATSTFTAHVEITFNGTENPLIVVNSSRSFVLDLNNGTVEEI